MLSQITPEQFDEWLAFGCFVEPFGSEIDWLKTGTITSMIFAANGGKGNGTNPGSYVPEFGKTKNTSNLEIFKQQMEAKYG
jgi:hypothetical protein